MSMFNIVRKEFQFGQHQVVLETGRVARQANTVLITMGGVTVLVAVVAAPTAKAGQDFFPLTVNYQEKQYAAGRIPGGYGKREGRASEAETLISRLIDRPIRPLFPEGYYNEIQVTATVVSSDKTMEADAILQFHLHVQLHKKRTSSKQSGLQNDSHMTRYYQLRILATESR